MAHPSFAAPFAGPGPLHGRSDARRVVASQITSRRDTPTRASVADSDRWQRVTADAERLRAAAAAVCDHGGITLDTIADLERWFTAATDDDAADADSDDGDAEGGDVEGTTEGRDWPVSPARMLLVEHLELIDELLAEAMMLRSVS